MANPNAKPAGGGTARIAFVRVRCNDGGAGIYGWDYDPSAEDDSEPVQEGPGETRSLSYPPGSGATGKLESLSGPDSGRP